MSQLKDRRTSFSLAVTGLVLLGILLTPAPVPPGAAAGAPIRSLALRVITCEEKSAGTDNHVYFDIGPLGWELTKPGSQFEAGSNETYPLDLHGLSLTTNDICWLRLQKK